VAFAACIPRTNIPIPRIVERRYISPMADHSKPFVRIAITAVAALLIAYPLSIGPTFWLWSRIPTASQTSSTVGGQLLLSVYSPLLYLSTRQDHRAFALLDSYIRLGETDDAFVVEVMRLKAALVWRDRLREWGLLPEDSLVCGTALEG
jgi:hypothetical protein